MSESKSLFRNELLGMAIVAFIAATIIGITLLLALRPAGASSLPSPILREWMEIAYFAHGVALVVIGLIALRQISVAKEDIQTRSQREAIVLAAERCKALADGLPRLKQNFAIVHAALPAAPELLDANFNWRSIDSQRGRAWVDKIRANDKADEAAFVVLNEMEAFAMYFARGAADEEIAYPVASALFFHFVDGLAPLIIAAREGDLKAVGGFQNIVDLYSCWAGRKRQQEISAALERAKTPAAKIKPIGT
jgi:hypothetical protein